MRIIMTALAPLECRHPRLGQSLWRLGVMRPQCLHAPCRSGRRARLPGGPSWGGVSPLRRFVPVRRGWGWLWAPGAPGVCSPPSPACVLRVSWGLGVVPPPPDLVSSGWLCAPPGGAAQWGGGSPRGRGAHRRHPRVPLVPSGTAVPYSPVCQRARSARWVSVCLAHPRLSPPLVCLRPVLPCARVLWCEAYGMWLLAPILWPRVHHLKGGGGGASCRPVLWVLHRSPCRSAAQSAWLLLLPGTASCPPASLDCIAAWRPAPCRVWLSSVPV